VSLKTQNIETAEFFPPTHMHAAKAPTPQPPTICNDRLPAVFALSPDISPPVDVPGSKVRASNSRGQCLRLGSREASKSRSLNGYGPHGGAAKAGRTGTSNRSLKRMCACMRN